MLNFVFSIYAYTKKSTSNAKRSKPKDLISQDH